MLSQLKKLFSRAKMKEKDKKTGILKNAALKIIYGAFKYRIKIYGLSWIKIVFT